MERVQLIQLKSIILGDSENYKKIFNVLILFFNNILIYLLIKSPSILKGEPKFRFSFLYKHRKRDYELMKKSAIPKF